MRLFRYVSCLYGYLCLRLVLRILFRTPLGCSEFSPVRSITSFRWSIFCGVIKKTSLLTSFTWSSVRLWRINENEYDNRTYGPIRLQEYRASSVEGYRASWYGMDFTFGLTAPGFSRSSSWLHSSSPSKTLLASLFFIEMRICLKYKRANPVSGVLPKI